MRFTCLSFTLTSLTWCVSLQDFKCKFYEQVFEASHFLFTMIIGMMLSNGVYYQMLVEDHWQTLTDHW